MDGLLFITKVIIFSVNFFFQINFWKKSFSGGETGNGMFKEPGIIIDGGRLKTEPWEVFKELEKDLGLLPYFDRSKFTQRPDGYFWDGLIYIS